MPGTNVRDVVGDIRFALATRLRDLYPRPDGPQGFSHTSEDYLVKGLSGTDLNGLQADYYIAPNDGGGPIVVVVENGNKANWRELKAKDGQPIRVLHVGLDRIVRLDNPRRTQFETDLLRVMDQVSAEYRKNKPKAGDLNL